MREETCCRHMGYSFWLAARVLLYAPSHRQDSTYHSLCYTSRGALAGTRNSWMAPPWRIDPTTYCTTSERSYHKSNWLSTVSVDMAVMGDNMTVPPTGHDSSAKSDQGPWCRWTGEEACMASMDSNMQYIIYGISYLDIFLVTIQNSDQRSQDFQLLLIYHFGSNGNISQTDSPKEISLF